MNPLLHEIVPSHQELKFLMRHRSRTTEKQSQLKVQFVRLLDILFPELAIIVGKANLHSQYIYDMFKSYLSPKKISRSRNKTFFQVLTSHRGRQLTFEIINKIKKSAKQTIGFLSASLELEPSVFQFGQYNLEGYMGKRGSTFLCWALIQAAKLAARFSPTFKTYLHKKLSEGKNYNVAITHMAKNL